MAKLDFDKRILDTLKADVAKCDEGYNYTDEETDFEHWTPDEQEMIEKEISKIDEFEAGFGDDIVEVYEIDVNKNIIRFNDIDYKKQADLNKTLFQSQYINSKIHTVFKCLITMKQNGDIPLLGYKVIFYNNCHCKIMFTLNHYFNDWYMTHITSIDNMPAKSELNKPVVRQCLIKMLSVANNYAIVAGRPDEFVINLYI